MALSVCRSWSEFAVRARPTKMAKSRSSLPSQSNKGDVHVVRACVRACVMEWKSWACRSTVKYGCDSKRKSKVTYAHLRVHDRGAEEHARGDGRLELFVFKGLYGRVVKIWRGQSGQPQPSTTPPQERAAPTRSARTRFMVMVPPTMIAKRTSMDQIAAKPAAWFVVAVSSCSGDWF